MNYGGIGFQAGLDEIKKVHPSAHESNLTSSFAANGNVEVHIEPRFTVRDSFRLLSVAFFLARPKQKKRKTQVKKVTTR